MTVLLAGIESQALTLGRIQGAALVGRALDVVVQVQLDADQTAATACLEADVFYADTRQDPSRVQVRAEPTAAPQTVNLRVSSSTAVDEPVVTVYLRAGCTQKTSRRYVMLADVVSEQAASFTPRVGAVPLVMPPPVSAPSAAAAAGGAGAAATGSGTAARVATRERNQAARSATATPARQRPARTAPVSAARPAKQRTTPVVKPAERKAAAAPQAVPEQAAVTAGKPRLKLDPLESLSERVAVLESSTASAPAAESAVAASRDAQRLDALEASMRTLVDLATKNEARMLEMQARLHKVESERYQNPVVYALGFLLLLALALIVFLFARMRRDSDADRANWWSSSTHGAPAAQEAAGAARIRDAKASGYAPMSEPAALTDTDGPASSRSGSTSATAATQQITRPATAATTPGAVNTQVDVSLVEMSESTFDRLMQSGTAHTAVRKAQDSRSFAPSGPATEVLPSTVPVAPADDGRRGINSEELIDIRQQAEFFVSLGQTDQAVQVLEKRIEEHGESSPQAYLDLLKLFHSLGLNADYRKVREDFSLLFNCDVPEFASFGNEGKDLEHYPALMDKVIAIWGKPVVLDTIESLLYRGQWRGDQDALDLAAFSDLLLLHAVAQYVAKNAGRSVEEPLPEIDAGPEIDIDLSELLDTPEPKASAAASASPPATEPVARPLGNLIDFDLTEVPADQGRPHKT